MERAHDVSVVQYGQGMEGKMTVTEVRLKW